MRKMTKTVVTLAAMSAMTAAAASMAFAASNSYTSIGKEAEVTATGTGDWDGDDVNGWTFTPTDGTKLKGTWAQINGVWYYFEKDGIMAQNKLLYLEGETYFFNADGSMMANGWVGLDNDSDILYDYGLAIQDNIDDIQNKVFKDEADAYETVWMYFNTDGTAKDDEWFQADSGLWYRFDDIIMVCGDFDHQIGNKRYGFDENGAMLVGWAENYVNKDIKVPNKDLSTWYYYNSDGTKFDVWEDNNGYGWKKIDGSWYCFMKIDGGAHSYSAGTLIMNAYFKNSDTAGTDKDTDFYYVDKKGVMATGVVTVDGNALYVDSTYKWDSDDGNQATSSRTVKQTIAANGSWDVYFNGDGKAQSNKWNGDRYYAGAGSDTVWILETETLKGDEQYTANAYAQYSKAVTDYNTYASYKNTAADIKGALVKNAFVNTDNDIYYVDKYGDKVKNSAVQVGYVVAKKTTVNGKDTYNTLTDNNGEVLFTNEVDAKNNLTNGYIVCKAYVVVNSKGIAYDDIDEGRTVTAGAKKYVSTGKDYTTENAQIFYYYNAN